MTFSSAPTRRRFLAGAGALAAAPLLTAKPAKSHLKIGVTDWNLNLSGKLEAVAVAASLGFEGVQISLGRRPGADQLPLASEEIQQQYLAELKKHSIAAAGTCLDILHVNYLKNDKLGQKWVADSIPITRKLNAKVVLLPFFGKGGLTTHAEMDYVGDFLREIAPEAHKNGVVLGLENMISAEDNVRILDRPAARPSRSTTMSAIPPTPASMSSRRSPGWAPRASASSTSRTTPTTSARARSHSPK